MMYFLYSASQKVPKKALWKYVYKSQCFFNTESRFSSLVASSPTLCKYYNPLLDYQNIGGTGNKTKKRKRFLVCGDGDFSYGASLAKEYHERRQSIKHSNDTSVDEDHDDFDIQLIVSVLESEEVHNQVYKDSIHNTQIIQKCGQEVRFGLDATKLENYFSSSEECFDIIAFNFPHWGGKENIRRNRLLIHEFFKSSSKLLYSGGQIHMGLIDHQGGMEATSIVDWKRSWMVGRLAAESKLLLTQVLPYKPGYNLSSYQCRDKPFLLHGRPQMYILTKPDNIQSASPDVQLCSYFSIFIAIPPYETTLRNNNDVILWSRDQIFDKIFVRKKFSKFVPKGIVTKVDCWRVHIKPINLKETDLKGSKTCSLVKQTAVEYRVYCLGETNPISATDVEDIKQQFEREISKMSPNTRHSTWKVANVIPKRLL